MASIVFIVLELFDILVSIDFKPTDKENLEFKK